MDSELLFEGKKYISASRASKITGYNSDYIGQLCRRGELDCRRIGRVWFVGEKSLSLHKTLAAQKPRGRIPKSSVVESQQASSALTPLVSESGDVLEQSDELSSPQSEGIATSYRPGEFSGHHAVEIWNEKPSLPRSIPVVFIILIISIFATPLVFDTASVSKIASEVKKVGSEQGLYITEKISESVSIVGDSLGQVDSSLALASDAIHNFRLMTGELTLRTYHVISLAIDRVIGMPKSLGKFVTNFRLSHLSYFDGKNKQDLVESDSDSVRAGVTVLPSTGDALKDEIVKEYVKNSFSDETRVVPDDSGTSGIIKPVFRKSNEQDYLYVIVPVKE